MQSITRLWQILTRLEKRREELLLQLSQEMYPFQGRKCAFLSLDQSAEYQREVASCFKTIAVSPLPRQHFLPWRKDSLHFLKLRNPSRYWKAPALLFLDHDTGWVIMLWRNCVRHAPRRSSILSSRHLRSMLASCNFSIILTCVFFIFDFYFPLIPTVVERESSLMGSCWVGSLLSPSVIYVYGPEKPCRF